MHRSGTSVLAKALQTFGVTVGNNLLDANEWNPTSYFEHAGIVEVNRTMLQVVGKRWDSLALPPWSEWAPSWIAFFRTGEAPMAARQAPLCEPR